MKDELDDIGKTWWQSVDFIVLKNMISKFPNYKWSGNNSLFLDDQFARIRNQQISEIFNLIWNEHPRFKELNQIFDIIKKFYISQLEKFNFRDKNLN